MSKNQIMNLVHIFIRLFHKLVFEKITFENIIRGFRSLRNKHLVMQLISPDGVVMMLLEFPKSHGIFGQQLPIFIQILDRQVNYTFNLWIIICCVRLGSIFYSNGKVILVTLVSSIIASIPVCCRIQHTVSSVYITSLVRTNGGSLIMVLYCVNL